MAKLRYTKTVGTTEMGLFNDPTAFTSAGDTAELADITAIQTSVDTVREIVGACNGFVVLADYDAFLEDKEFELRDRLDYYNYDIEAINVDEREGAWFSPDSVEAFGSEDPGFPATNTIDGDNSTQWRHEIIETHTFTWKLRDYPKKITKMRLRYGAGENIRERLTNITIRAAKNLNNIDETNNIIATGVNPTWPIGAGNTWFEIDWPVNKNRGRYIKLEFETEHGNNHARIREIEFRVETRNPQTEL